MARKNEKDCLERVKKALAGRSNDKLFSSCEINDISKLLFSAVENPDGNAFPDFVFDGGGIEHFELTSSKETTKGSAFRSEEKRNQRKRQELEDKAVKAFSGTPYVPGTMESHPFENVYSGFTYASFLNSLRKNVTHHVESLLQKGYENKVVVFLMEQPTARMWYDNGSSSVKFYDLHKDKEALTMIKAICGPVKYLIYQVADSIEIIDLSTIDELITNAIVYKNVQGGRLVVPNPLILINH